MDKISLSALLIGFAIGLGSVAICFSMERLRPVGKQGIPALRFNLLYYLPASLLQAVLAPIASALTVMTVNAGGGGLIALPDTGWPLLSGFLIYLLTMDCGEYAFHRAQHRFALLWSMHALHHSDVDLNASTALRHYWLEHFLKCLTIYLGIALIFKVGETTLALYAIASFYNYFSHMNLKIGFGRWSFLINAPQYHRIHHSALAGHRDRNFAGMFPVFDVLFDTYYRPTPFEFPATGLDGGERPAGLAEALIWPIRNLLRNNPNQLLDRL